MAYGRGVSRFEVVTVSPNEGSNDSGRRGAVVEDSCSSTVEDPCSFRGTFV